MAKYDRQQFMAVDGVSSEPSITGERLATIYVALDRKY